VLDRSSEIFTQKTIWTWRSSNKLDRDQPFIFFSPPFFVYSPLCVSSIQSGSACSSFIICGVGYFCQGEFVDVPAARAIDLSNTEWLREKLVLCNKFEILSFVNLCFFCSLVCVDRYSTPLFFVVVCRAEILSSDIGEVHLLVVGELWEFFVFRKESEQRAVIISWQRAFRAFSGARESTLQSAAWEPLFLFLHLLSVCPYTSPVCMYCGMQRRDFWGAIGEVITVASCEILLRKNLNREQQY
jgi:hypothetical protein